MKTPRKLYWGKTIASFFLVLFTMPLGHALMRVMEDTMSQHAVNVSAFIMGAVGLAIAIWGVFVKGDTKQTLFGLFGGKRDEIVPRNMSRHTAITSFMELNIMMWTMYLLLMFVYDPVFLGESHPVTIAIAIGCLVGSIFMFKYELKLGG